jgi:hypothetical protein
MFAKVHEHYKIIYLITSLVLCFGIMIFIPRMNFLKFIRISTFSAMITGLVIILFSIEIGLIGSSSKTVVDKRLYEH